jgi:Chitobiase/beta-hexosaminidase C-terminal domain
MMTQQRWIIFLMCFFVQGITAQKTYQLATPIATYESVFFEKQTSISFKFEQPGTTIRYTTDGSEPNASSAVYKKPIRIKKHQTVVKAAAFGEGFHPSETVALSFFSQGLHIANIKTSAPNTQYAGSGANTLNDTKSGGTDHHNGAWLGFDSDSIVVDIFLEKSTTVSQVLLHVLSNQDAWIFAPQKVMVYAVENGSDIWVQAKTFETKPEEKTDAKAILIDLPKTSAAQFRMVVYPLAALPEWHAGKGKKAWCFIDEIKMY